MNSKQLLIVTIATFATILVWVVTDIIHSRSKVTVPQEVQSLLEPVSPNIDPSAIEALQQP